jgi:hypothetical protein
MKKSKFTEQQIAFALQQAESGTQVAATAKALDFGVPPIAKTLTKTETTIPASFSILQGAQDAGIEERIN